MLTTFSRILEAVPEAVPAIVTWVIYHVAFLARELYIVYLINNSAMVAFRAKYTVCSASRKRPPLGNLVMYLIKQP